MFPNFSGQSSSGGGSSSSTRTAINSSMSEAVSLERVQVLKSNRSSATNRASQILDSLSINKLRFSELGLYGRDDEIEQLRQIWNIVARRQGPTTKSDADDTAVASSSSSLIRNHALVLIEALSGTGKTRLVSTLIEPVKKERGFFVSAKFDVKQIEIPFMGITMAVDHLCDEILLLNDDDPGGTTCTSTSSSSSFSLPSSKGDHTSTIPRFEEIKHLLQQELERELLFLVKMFPRLKEVVGDEYASQHINHGGHGDDVDFSNELDLKGNSGRLTYCFRRLIAVVCSFAPLLIFCDDIHWADQDSLDLLYQILSDTNSSSLLIVGCYRSNLVDGSHPVTKFVNDLAESPDGQHPVVPIHDIKLDDLDVDSLNGFLADLLLHRREDTLCLASILHQKTKGNIFFVIQLLLALQKQQLLLYNIGLLEWVWKDDEIQLKCPTADNVGDLVKEKLENDTVARQILPIAACLGATFDAETIKAVIRVFRQKKQRETQRKTISAYLSSASGEFDLDDSSSIFDKCVKEGFIEMVDVDAYRFIHDQVQEASPARGTCFTKIRGG